MLRDLYPVGFSRAALRRRSLIRRCQPGPRRRKCSMTSGSSRNETSFLVVSDFGRPRSGLPALCGVPRAKSFSVSSGISRYSRRPMVWLSLLRKSLPITRFFSVIGLPHRHNVPRIFARRPYDNHHSAKQVPHADRSRFAVVVPQIGDVDRHAGKHLARVSEIQATLAQSGRAFRGVEGDPHGYNVATKNASCKTFVATENVVLPEGTA